MIKQVHKEPGVFEWLGWSYPERTKTSMDKAFTPVAAITPYEYPAAKPKAEITTLKNGLRIISEKAPVGVKHNTGVLHKSCVADDPFAIFAGFSWTHVDRK